MVAIISIGDIYHTPYIFNYIKRLNNNNTPYKIIYWNRNPIIPSQTNEHTIPITVASNLNSSKIIKLFHFFKFFNKVTRLIRKNKFNKLIILTTLSGVFLSNLLLFKYNNKYIFDIRDYSYEKNSLYRILVKLLIKKSFFSSISSEGFKEFLGKSNKLFLFHNFTDFEVSNSKTYSKNDRLPIVITYIGTLRYFSYQKMIIEKLNNNTNFILNYYGDGPDLYKFRKLVLDLKSENVKVYGKYNNSSKLDLLKNSTFINNAYGTNDINETVYALSNRFYDSVFFGIPQIVEQNSFKDKILRRSGLRFSIDVNSKNLDLDIISIKNSLDETKVNRVYSSLRNQFMSDNSTFYLKLNEFLNND